MSNLSASGCTCWLLAENSRSVRDGGIRFVPVYRSLEQTQRDAGRNRCAIAIIPVLGIVEIAREHDVAVTFLTFDTWNEPGSALLKRCGNDPFDGNTLADKSLQVHDTMEFMPLLKSVLSACQCSACLTQS